ncbi:MAG: YfcE family phosphodiesterase [Candidatus Bathyarchaeia archaeon]|jgi:putative phosphoesterase
MNTQPTSQTCELNTSYCRFGAETLLKLLDGVDDLIDGVIENTDIECIHKTRVASRRLRAALPLFSACFDKKDYRDWTKEIKKVTKLLSQARDLDVQIAFIEQYLKKLSSAEEKACINVLLKDHKSCRKNVQSPVDSGLKELKDCNTLGDVAQNCKDIVAQELNQPFDPNQVLEKAYWHISYRLDDFLSLAAYVYMEKEKLKHHQMRIYAKKLRYTMECFAPLYPDKLNGEIQTIKRFQDVLGEMHDCDVWIDYIPQFNKKVQGKTKLSKGATKLKINQALHNFQAYVVDRRKNNYNQFVKLWEEKQENGFFDKLLEKTSRHYMALTQERIKQALADPNVKIALISDVHANLQASEKVLEDAQSRGANVFLNAGDSIGFGANPNEVIEMLCEQNGLSIVGNYDIEVLEGKSDAKGEKKASYKFAKKELSQSAKCYLQSLPHELRLEAAGQKLLVTHGSPESIEEHIYQDTPPQRLEILAADAKSDIIVVGHSHEQFQRLANGAYFINPGSVGRPGDGNPQAAYALLSFNPFKVDLIRLDYDVWAAADALRKEGLPESFAQMLLRGVSLDVITKEDRARAGFSEANCSKAVEASSKFSGKQWPDVDHYKQVTNLALSLFDGLAKLHNLGRRERCWLECAAMLHDVGLSKNSGKHHKNSMQIILNSTQLPFSSMERRVVASIARYHRKAMPKQKHYNLASLNRATIQTICVLSSILRLADSLDYTHESNVKLLGVKVGAKKVTVECASNSDFALEEQAFNKKKDLFEKVFNRKTMLVWKQ